MFEVFDHTADLGLRIAAPTLERLLEEAALGLTSILVGDVSAIRSLQEDRFSLPGGKPDDLLVDWLAEVLCAFDARRMLYARFEVEVDASGLRARAWGEPFDPARHAPRHEVKAITYHGLEVRRVEGGWEATVVVDI